MANLWKNWLLPALIYLVGVAVLTATVVVIVELARSSNG
jgi:hypothetical protein